MQSGVQKLKMTFVIYIVCMLPIQTETPSASYSSLTIFSTSLAQQNGYTYILSGH